MTTPTEDSELFDSTKLNPDDPSEISEYFFDNQIRISGIYSLLSLVHSESLSEDWEELLEDPSQEVSDLLKALTGIDIIGVLDDMDSSAQGTREATQDLAHRLMVKGADRGFLVQYDQPILASSDGTHYGFGHLRHHYIYTEVVDNAAMIRVAADFERNREIMRQGLLEKEKEKYPKPKKTGSTEK